MRHIYVKMICKHKIDLSILSDASLHYDLIVSTPWITLNYFDLE